MLLLGAFLGSRWCVGVETEPIRFSVRSIIDVLQIPIGLGRVFGIKTEATRLLWPLGSFRSGVLGVESEASPLLFVPRAGGRGRVFGIEAEASDLAPASIGNVGNVGEHGVRGRSSLVEAKSRGLFMRHLTSVSTSGGEPGICSWVGRIEAKSTYSLATTLLDIQPSSVRGGVSGVESEVTVLAT